MGSLYTEQELKVIEESKKRIRSTRLKKKELKGHNFFVVEYTDLPSNRVKKEYFQTLDNALFCYKFYTEYQLMGVLGLRLYKEYCKEDIEGLIKDIL